MHERLATLERQVHRLRRTNRRLLLSVVAFGVLASVGAGVGAMRSPEVLRAKRIQMVDDNERVRAELGIDEQGSAGLFVMDDKGLVRATLVHDDAQTAMYLLDEEGEVRLGAAQFAHGGGGFALHGPESKGAAVLILKDQVGSLTFYDKSGEVVMRSPASTGTQNQRASTPASSGD
jgi:hypothetical protein